MGFYQRVIWSDFISHKKLCYGRFIFTECA